MIHAPPSLSHSLSCRLRECLKRAAVKNWKLGACWGDTDSPTSVPTLHLDLIPAIFSFALWRLAPHFFDLSERLAVGRSPHWCNSTAGCLFPTRLVGTSESVKAFGSCGIDAGYPAPHASPSMSDHGRKL